MTIEYREVHDVDLDALRLRVNFGAKSRDDVKAQVDGACWGVAAYDGKRSIGFARAISDGITNAYVGSVMVDPDYQRRGIGREIMRRIVGGRDHIRFVFHAQKDAMPFYRALGFTDAPDMMWRDRKSS